MMQRLKILFFIATILVLAWGATLANTPAMQALISYGDDGPVLTVSNVTVSDGTGPTAIAGVRYNTTGTVDRNLHGSYAQVNASTDWIIPNAAASSAYSIRATLFSSSGPGSRTGTVGSWENLGTNREWKLTSSAIASWILIIEISDDGGTTVIDNATISLSTDPI